MIASKNWILNATAAVLKKIRRWLDWSVDNFDSMKIRLGKSAKFDGAGVYRSLVKFRKVTPTNPEVIGTHMLNFKPNF